MHYVAITQECFRDILALKSIPEDGDAREVYTNLRQGLDQLALQHDSVGLCEQDGQNIVYAISALADEVALRGTTSLAHFWSSRTLQMHYFQENTAGEGFFTRLDELRHHSAGGEALKVFYLALALGFQGRYGITGSNDELVAVTTMLRRAIMAPNQANLILSPQALPKPLSQHQLRRWAHPYKQPLILGVGALLLSLAMSSFLAGKRHTVEASVSCATALGREHD